MILTFTGDTRAEIEEQLRDFLGDSSAAPAATTRKRNSKKTEPVAEEEETPAETKTGKTVSMIQIRELLDKVAKTDRAKVKKYMSENYDVEQAADIPKDQYEDFYAYLKTVVG